MKINIVLTTKTNCQLVRYTKLTGASKSSTIAYFIYRQIVHYLKQPQDLRKRCSKVNKNRKPLNESKQTIRTSARFHEDIYIKLLNISMELHVSLFDLMSNMINIELERIFENKKEAFLEKKASNAETCKMNFTTSKIFFNQFNELANQIGIKDHDLLSHLIAERLLKGYLDKD